MYMILLWQSTIEKGSDDFLTCILNKDGSIKLFDTLKEADKEINSLYNPDDTRVISIEGDHRV